LGARKGERNAHHFSHQTGDKHDGESVLHQVAKMLLVELVEKGQLSFSKKYRFTLYATEECVMNAKASETRYSENYTEESYHELNCETLVLTDPTIEGSIDNSLRADVLCHTDTGEPFALEVYVTNQKDDVTIAKYRERDVTCLEIDLSALSVDTHLTTIAEALKNPNNHKWLHLSEKLGVIQAAKSKFLQSEQVSDWLQSIHDRKAKWEQDKSQRELLAQLLAKQQADHDAREERFKKQVEAEGKLARAKWGELKLPRPEPKDLSQPIKRIRNKPDVREKRVKVKFVKTHPPYRSGQITELPESQAVELMKHFILRIL
jgi:hypothetical protein